VIEPVDPVGQAPEVVELAVAIGALQSALVCVLPRLVPFPLRVCILGRGRGGGNEAVQPPQVAESMDALGAVSGRELAGAESACQRGLKVPGVLGVPFGHEDDAVPVPADAPASQLLDEARSDLVVRRDRAQKLHVQRGLGEECRDLVEAG
jgi:hypothetical protein